MFVRLIRVKEIWIVDDQVAGFHRERSPGQTFVAVGAGTFVAAGAGVYVAVGIGVFVAVGVGDGGAARPQAVKTGINTIAIELVRFMLISPFALLARLECLLVCAVQNPSQNRCVFQSGQRLPRDPSPDATAPIALARRQTHVPLRRRRSESRRAAPGDRPHLPRDAG